jgi:competence ComEA-like helix-hairpin-helix protein
MSVSRGVIFVMVLLLFNLNYVAASCEEGQIDINSASVEELDKIIYIGPARAEQIIALRPFNSVDNLTRVSGIGEVYLSAIKLQGLACVDGLEEDEEEENETYVNSNETTSEEDETNRRQNQSKPERETIVLNPLNPQVIKTEEDKKGINKNYAIYGFVAFCILIGILFIIKNIKNRKYKNEFR